MVLEIRRDRGMWGTLLWRWQGCWWWSSLKTKNQRLNFDRRWVLFLFSKEERSRGLKINLLKTYRRWVLLSPDFSEYIHQTLPNESSGGGISQETRHSSKDRINDFGLRELWCNIWNSCHQFGRRLHLYLTPESRRCIWILMSLFRPNPKSKISRKWHLDIKSWITYHQFSFFIVAKTLRCISWYFIKRVREGGRRGNDEDSVKKVCETTRASDIYSFM